MAYKTVETYVEVDLDEWDDDELAEELRDRGWFVSKVDTGVEKFERETGLPMTRINYVKLRKTEM